MTNVRSAVGIALAGALLLAAGGRALGADNVVREGEGLRRMTLNTMELKPFPGEAWAGLTDWTNGRAVSAGDIDGKVVLILTWADWYPASKRAVAVASRLADTHAKEGLVVVAAHDPQGWAEAQKPAAGKDSAFLLAHDAKGEFRKALQVDQDPDFYVIDRAGQLRFADIATESVEGAIRQLLGETADTASGLSGKLAADAKAADEQRRRTDSIRQSVSLTDLPEVPFPEPGPEVYAALKWPAPPKDPNAQQDPNQVPPLVKLSIPEAGFKPSRPELKGRAVLLYFWHPSLHETFLKVMPRMDLLQRQKGRDLAVIGVLTPMTDSSGQVLPGDNDPAKIQQRIDDLSGGGRLGHSLLLDLQGTLLAASRRNDTQAQALPFVAIMSSDGVMRWSGSMREPAFQAALDKVLTIDPAVNARRQAEEQYLREKSK